MPGRAQAKPVVLSLLAHAAVGIWLGQASREVPPAADDFEIEIAEPEPAEEEPEPAEEEPEETEAPETPPEVALSDTRPPPSEAPPAEQGEPGPVGPLASGVEMDGASSGGDGPAAGPATRPAPTRPPPAAARPDQVATPAPPPAGQCSEPASKPKPASRPRDIEYLDDARAREVEGRLVLAVTVAPDGSVAAVEVKSPVDPALDAAAVEAVKTWRFEPAHRCGKPIEGNFTLARRFVLGD